MLGASTLAVARPHRPVTPSGDTGSQQRQPAAFRRGRGAAECERGGAISVPRVDDRLVVTLGDEQALGAGVLGRARSA